MTLWLWVESMNWYATLLLIPYDPSTHPYHVATICFCSALSGLRDPLNKCPVHSCDAFHTQSAAVNVMWQVYATIPHLSCWQEFNLAIQRLSFTAHKSNPFTTPLLAPCFDPAPCARGVPNCTHPIIKTPFYIPSELYGHFFSPQVMTITPYWSMILLFAFVLVISLLLAVIRL